MFGFGFDFDFDFDFRQWRSFFAPSLFYSSIALANQSSVLLFSFQGELNQAAQLCPRANGSWEEQEDHHRGPTAIQTNEALGGRSFQEVFGHYKHQTDQQGGVQYQDDEEETDSDDVSVDEGPYKENYYPQDYSKSKSTMSSSVGKRNAELQATVRQQAEEIRKLNLALKHERDATEEEKEIAEKRLEKNGRLLAEIKALKAKVQDLQERLTSVCNSGKKAKKDDLPLEELQAVQVTTKNQLWRRVKFIVNDDQATRNTVEVLQMTKFGQKIDITTPEGKRKWMDVPKFAHCT
jgi:phage host-nuclease inhibitor protein Gam